MSETIRQHAEQLQKRFGNLPDPGGVEQGNQKSKTLMEREQKQIKVKLETHEKLSTLQMRVDPDAIAKQGVQAQQDLLKETANARGNYQSVGLNSIMNVYYLRAQHDRLLTIQEFHKFQQQPDGTTITGVFVGPGMPLQENALYERYRALQAIDQRMVAYRRDITHIQRHAHIAMNAHKLSAEKFSGKTILEHLQDPALLKSLEAQVKEGGAPGRFADRRKTALLSLQKSIPSNTVALEQNVKETDERVARFQRILLLQQLEAAPGANNADIVALRAQEPALNGLTPGTPEYNNQIAAVGDSLSGEIRTRAQESVDVAHGQANNQRLKLGDALMSDLYQALTIVSFQKMQDSALGFDFWLPHFQRSLTDEMIMQTERATFDGLMLANDLSNGALHIGSLPTNQAGSTITPEQLAAQQSNPAAQMLLASQWDLYRGMLTQYADSIGNIVNKPADGPLGGWMAWLWNDRGSGVGQNIVSTTGGAIPRVVRGAVWLPARTALAPINIPWQMLMGNKPFLTSSRIQRAEKAFAPHNRELQTVDDAFTDFRDRNQAHLGLTGANMRMIALLHSNASPDDLRLLGRSPESPFAPEPAGGAFGPLKQTFAKNWATYQTLRKSYMAAAENNTATEKQGTELVTAYSTAMETYINGLNTAYRAQLTLLGVGPGASPQKLLEQIAKTPREVLIKDRARYEQLFRVQSLLAGTYVWLLQDMQHGIIPAMMGGNTDLMQGLGYVAATNTAETHILADIIQGGGIAAGLYTLGRFGRMQATAEAGRGLASVPYLRTLAWGGPQHIPLVGRIPVAGNIADKALSATARFFVTAGNPFAVYNGVYGILRPSTAAPPTGPAAGPAVVPPTGPAAGPAAAPVAPAPVPQAPAAGSNATLQRLNAMRNQATNAVAEAAVTQEQIAEMTTIFRDSTNLRTLQTDLIAASRGSNTQLLSSLRTQITAARTALRSRIAQLAPQLSVEEVAAMETVLTRPTNAVVRPAATAPTAGTAYVGSAEAARAIRLAERAEALQAAARAIRAGRTVQMAEGLAALRRLIK